MSKVLIYTENPHPRLAYAIRFIQQYNPEHTWVITSSLDEYLNDPGPSINYSKREIKDSEIHYHSSDWLYKDPSSYAQVSVRHTGMDFQLFPNLHDNGFDVFASIFYIIARVEEYLPFEQDIHLRFAATESLLYKNNILELPIVDIWIKRLYHSIETKFNIDFKIKPCNPSWSLGIDVDQFYKYKHKNAFTSVGGLFKSILKANFSESLNRIQVLLFNKKDPYNSYDQIRELNISKKQLRFFILSGGYSDYDKNHSLHHPKVQEILKSLISFSEIGLHPSYSASKSEKELRSEKAELEKCIHLSIEDSRQHFLKIRFPDTYSMLLHCGIKKDYSLGYADLPGFRAGTGRPYFWYDLKNETETNLMLTPFVAMDRTYLDYLKYSPAKTIEHIQKLFETCIHSGGHFHLIWHNSSYDFEGEWKNWNFVLESIITNFKSHDH